MVTKALRQEHKRWAWKVLAVSCQAKKDHGWPDIDHVEGGKRGKGQQDWRIRKLWKWQSTRYRRDKWRKVEVKGREGQEIWYRESRKRKKAESMRGTKRQSKRAKALYKI